jgi:hypothetical protein
VSARRDVAARHEPLRSERTPRLQASRYGPQQLSLRVLSRSQQPFARRADHVGPAEAALWVSAAVGAAGPSWVPGQRQARIPAVPAGASGGASAEAHAARARSSSQRAADSAESGMGSGLRQRCRG